jgi:HlyD family secretion protein
MISSRGLKSVLILVIMAAIILGLRLTVFAPKRIPISVYTVKKGNVEETLTNSKAGTWMVRRKARVSPEIGGRVVFLGAREGETVSEGSVLIRLDDSEGKAHFSVAENGLKLAQAAAQEACVSNTVAEKEANRNRPLHQNGMISNAAWDQIMNRYEMSLVHCKTANADVQRAKASVGLARANLSKTELTAPFGGVITEMTTEVGEWVSPSPSSVSAIPIIRLQDTNSIYLNAPMDEADSGRLQIGLPVRVSLAPFPGQFFHGELVRVAPFVEDIQGQNRTVNVEAELTDKAFSKLLLPGTSADLEVILDLRENVLRIRTYALMEGNSVLFLNGNRLSAHRVEVGLRNWEFVEIRSGLNEGDQIAVSLDRPEVKDGALVTVTDEVDP